MITAVFFTSLLLLVWFRTNAFCEYMKVFGLDEFFYIREYTEDTKEGLSLTYPEYLLERKSSFFTRLINCPICMSVWSGIITSFFNPLLMPVITILGLLIYLITTKLL